MEGNQTFNYLINSHLKRTATFRRRIFGPLLLMKIKLGMMCDKDYDKITRQDENNLINIFLDKKSLKNELFFQMGRGKGLILPNFRFNCATI
jgi:hypothetical protein